MEVNNYYGYTPQLEKKGRVLVSRIASPYPGANHVAPPAAKDEKEYRTRSPPRRKIISGYRGGGGGGGGAGAPPHQVLVDEGAEELSHDI